MTRLLKVQVHGMEVGEVSITVASHYFSVVLLTRGVTPPIDMSKVSIQQVRTKMSYKTSALAEM